MYIYRSITYPPFNIGSCSIESTHNMKSRDGYARAESIPYTPEELEAMPSEKEQMGVLYITIR